MEIIENFYIKHTLFFQICIILFVAYYLILFLSSDFFNELIKNLYKRKIKSKNLYKFDPNQDGSLDTSSDDLSEKVLDLDIEMDPEVLQALDSISKQHEQLSVETELDDFLKQSGIDLNRSEED